MFCVPCLSFYPACTSSSGNFMPIPRLGTHRTHSLAPLLPLVRRLRQEARTRRNVASARLMQRPIQSSLAPCLSLHKLYPYVCIYLIVSTTYQIRMFADVKQEVKKGHCGSLDKTNVLPYLKDNLHWRVTLADGTEKDRDEVPGLLVSVVSTEVALPVGQRPRYSGVYTVHPEVTAGRPAGLGNNVQPSHAAAPAAGA